MSRGASEQVVDLLMDKITLIVQRRREESAPLSRSASEKKKRFAEILMEIRDVNADRPGLIPNAGAVQAELICIRGCSKAARFTYVSTHPLSEQLSRGAGC